MDGKYAGDLPSANRVSIAVIPSDPFPDQQADMHVRILVQAGSDYPKCQLVIGRSNGRTFHIRHSAKAVAPRRGRNEHSCAKTDRSPRDSNHYQQADRKTCSYVRDDHWIILHWFRAFSSRNLGQRDLRLPPSS
jgi:hypothetical protein